MASSTHEPKVAFDPSTQMITVSPNGKTATSTHTASMVLLHGLGDSARGWFDVAAYFSQALPHVNFVLPTAPSQPVTLNMGARMPSWYDIKGLKDRASETCEGIEQSRETVLGLISAEVEKGIPLNRIVLGGFSQGGALSLWTGLQELNLTPAAAAATGRGEGKEEAEGAQQLAGVLAMSGYLCNDAQFKPSPSALSIPVMQAHGEDDPMVLYAFATATREALSAAGFTQLTFKAYPGLTHSVHQQELDDVLEWLTARLPPSAANQQ